MGDTDNAGHDLESLAHEWFDTQSGEILQGTLLPDLPEALVSPDDETLVGATRRKLAIVLTQSCDVRKTKNLLIARVWTYGELRQQNQGFASRSYAEGLKKGTAVGHFLMPPPTPASNVDWLVASFRETFHVPASICRKRLIDLGQSPTLRSPYLEHLSQAYARFVMRVALPPNSDPLADLFDSHVEKIKAKPQAST